MDLRQNILVGVDFRAGSSELSVGSQKAARQAAWIAGQNGARVCLLHSTYPEEGGGRSPGELKPDHHAALESLVGELSREVSACELAIVEGKAWREITERVLSGAVDLVVVGKRNGSGETEPRLGSVAAKLVRNCPGPVWCVRPEHDLGMRLLLAASDLTPVGAKVCASAAWIAKRHACELHLLHAYASQSADASVDDMRQAAKEALVRAAAEPTLEPSTHLVKGKASAAIREAVEHLGPDLLVLGATSRGEPGHLLGDTAERVVTRVPCSLLTFKPDDFVSPLS